MRFSVFLNARTTAPEQDRQLILDLVEHATRAEQLGFDAVFLPDHHFTGYMPVCSDPMMFAAYLAGSLKKLHFGFSVTSVPLHSPVRFAERVNILDQLTDGKLLVGIGSGTTPEEMVGFGVNYQESPAVSNANLEIAEKLWAKQIDDAPIVFDNGPYKGEVIQRIAPAPYTPGHARLMPVAMRETSAKRAADHGWPAFIPAFTPPNIGGTDPLSHVTKYFTKYRDLLLAVGHDAAVVKDALSWTTHTYQCVHIADSEDQARDELMVILRDYQDAVDREKIHSDKAEQNDANQKTDETPLALTEDWIATWCLFGTAKTVREHLEPYAKLGIGNILCGTTTGPLSPQRLAWGDRTLEKLSTEVMPHFRAAAQ